MRHIQRRCDQFHTGLKHQLRRFGVNIDVKFSRGRDIANLKISPAHQDNLCDALGDIRRPLQGGGNICQRAKGAECDGLWRRCAQGADDKIYRVGALQVHHRRGERRPIQSAVAMDMFCRDQTATHGAVTARKHWQIGATCQFADLPRVVAGALQRDIARNTGQSQNVKFLRRQGQQDCHRIILAGIRVNNDVAAHRLTSLYSYGAPLEPWWSIGPTIRLDILQRHIPRKEDPSVLADFGNECIHHRAALRFGIDRGEMGLRIF